MRIISGRKSQFENGEPELLPAPAWNSMNPAMPGRGDDTVWISHVARVIWRRKLAIVGVTMLGLLIGIAVTVLKTPVYRAQASIQVEGFNDNFLRDVTPISPLLANATAESYVRNQLNLVKSDRLAQRVADRLGIESRPVASNPTMLAQLARKTGLLPGTPPTAEQERILRVQDAMESRMVPQSHIIEVLYSAPDPKLAAMGANAAADEFIALNRESRWQLAQDTTEWLTKQAADLKSKLERDSRRLQEYARASGIMFTGNQQTQTVEQERMRQLQDALGRAEAEQAAKQSRYEAALGNATESLPDQMAAGPLQRYLGELQTLKQERAQLRSMYTPAHYKVTRVEAQIAELESAIDKERRSMVERLKTEYDAANRLQRLLATANSRQLAQLQVQSEKEAGYSVLKREVESTQQMYDDMLHRAKEAGLASALRTTNIRVIDPARAPSRPYSPNLALNLAAGLLFGLMGGVGLAFFRERSNIIKQPGDATALNLPELGVIPSAKDDRRIGRAKGALIPMSAGKPELALVTWQHDTSLLSESFRAALTSILFSSGLHEGSASARRGAVLVVSSTDAMEGKTTVVSNLGAALAQAGRRVLLIDGDLRKPSLHKVFGMPNEDSGLTDLLRSPDTMEAVNVENSIRETAVPGLWVLPSGTGRNGIPKLLYATNLNSLLQRFRAEFDLVLVDSPPMGLLTDARILGRLSDGVVLVVRANRARTDALRATCMRLLQDGIPVLGTILNDCRLDGSNLRTYSQYYRHYGAANGA